MRTYLGDYIDHNKMMTMTMVIYEDDKDGDDQNKTDMESVDGGFCSNAVPGSDLYPMSEHHHHHKKTKKRFLSGIARIMGGGSSHARILLPLFFTK